MLKFLIAILLMMFGVSGISTHHSFSSSEPVIKQNLAKISDESDEFLNYWREDFRKDEEGNIIAICDIKYASFKEMYSKYILLNDYDKSIVDATDDYEENFTIKESIKTLISRFGENNTIANNKEKRTLDQSSSIIIIVVVAVFGMSTISVFYVLKRDNIIQ